MHRHTDNKRTSGRVRCTTRQRATYQDGMAVSLAQIRVFICRPLAVRARQIRDSNIFYLACARRTVPVARSRLDTRIILNEVTTNGN